MTDPVMPTRDDGVSNLKVGDVIAGKYRVDGVLGKGGMGVVLAAHHVKLDERVALKFLRPEAFSTPQAVQRFLREAQAAARIKSEHVVRVMDVGEFEGGIPYMVMEYLEGKDLAKKVAHEGALPPSVAVDYILEACEAIAEAHAHGIVHRDLKPSNLFCAVRAPGRTTIKVLDFGISKVGVAASGETPDMTNTSMLLGTPAYMSPEQMVSSKDVDAQTDIWSIGVILYQLLSGRVPVRCESVAELIIRVATEPAPLIRSVKPEIPTGLERAIAICLERDRSIRYGSIRALAEALLPFGGAGARASYEHIVEISPAQPMPQALSSSPSSARVLGAGSDAAAFADTANPWSRPGASPPSPATPATGGETPGPPGNKRLSMGLAVFGVTFLVALAIGIHVVRQPAPPPALDSFAAPAPAPTPAPVTTQAPEPAPLPPATAVPVAPAETAAPPAPRSASPPPKRVKSSAKANCDPPFTIDANGTRRFKTECL